MAHENAVGDLERFDRLRAIEQQLLRPRSPIPDDPTTTFPEGYIRVATIPADQLVVRAIVNGQVIEPQQMHGALRRPRRHRHPAPFAYERPQRHRHAQPPAQPNVEQQQQEDRVRLPAPEDERRQRQREQVVNQEDRLRRALSPTQLPGVRAIPKEFNRAFRGLLTPGEYFAKSASRYIGPFPVMPNNENLPAGDNFIVLQRMGRLPDSGKSIFRQVGVVFT